MRFITTQLPAIMLAAIALAVMRNGKMCTGTVSAPSSSASRTKA